MQMKKTLAPGVLSVLVFFASEVHSARAADFTFVVPVTLTNFAPETVRSQVMIFCNVSRALDAGGGPAGGRDLVGTNHATYDFGPGPINGTTEVTVEVNASNPRLLPASEGRYYACVISQFALWLSDGSNMALHPELGMEDTQAAYTAATGHALLRMEGSLQGEIPR